MKGGRSTRMTPEAIAEVKSRTPQATMTVVPDADHHITLDNPAGFIRCKGLATHTWRSICSEPDIQTLPHRRDAGRRRRYAAGKSKVLHFGDS
jgi:hypothetical protein